MTGTTRTWNDEYEAQLNALLDQFITRNQTAAATAAAGLQQKVEENGWSNMTGPLGYRIGWDGDKIIDAETRTGLATFAARMMDDGKYGAEEILGELLTACRRLVKDALQAQSTSEWGNLVARAAGRSAQEQLDTDWNGLGAMASKAQFQTEQQITGELNDFLRQAKKQQADANAKASRAKTEASIEKAKDVATAAKHRVTYYQREMARVLTEAGAPDGLAAKWMQLANETAAS